MSLPTPICRRKITVEMKEAAKSNDKYIIMKFDPQNILNCYYVFIGPEETPFEGGMYFGKVVIPTDYPFRPPSLLMYTPSGRFAVDTRICISISDFHPETWNPAYNISSVLTGLLSFMTSNETGTGSFNDPPQKQRAYAKASMEWNAKNTLFAKFFPEFL
ncbi:ubiquitin-conjugating enzyme E2, putative [Entamoeba invadens IP1]|uniref:Ubiquitin-conjugating enzyme E2, putative n=1 Tax=Entamoeba invadens IP1 TaxID=370355 RepID=A0A0A1UC10_ENTIV|nr:ubiquitin-conjugating enzyme E2, putative [Entamoeba invadens IP1]ELP92765.1 ubiquitin-conjugating enzyme E2, putative [Entamoeba invadens IP1]|eukprot:XP_004259536.1 ubiquitin-conjugating enzyme E2, putative [Entamoeba invadens IP1]